MKLKGFKKTIAAVMALVIIGGAMPAIPGGLMPVKPITASAAPEQQGSVVLENGVLTLSGYVTYSMLAPYFHNEEVTSVYALEGTVFSGNCSHMFANRVVDYDLIKGTDRYLNLKSIDLHNVDTSGVTDMMGMFYGLPALESLNVSGWDTSNVTSMYSMFCECDKLTSIDVSSFDTSKVSRMPYMFFGCKSLTSLDLSNFDTSNVDNMCMMFEDCTSLRTLDISSFSSNSNPWTMAMFRNCSSLKTIYASAGFSSEPGNSEMFKGCSSLVGGNLTRCDGVNNITGQYARIDKSNAPGFFTDKFCTFDEATGTLTLTGYVSKNEMDVNYIHNPEMNAKIKHIVAEDTAVLPAGCQNLFGQLAALETVDFSRIDSSAVTSINGMFYKCKNLRSIDLTGFDTSSIVDMRYAFNNCAKLEKIYVNKKWNVSGTEDEGVYSSGMFYNCTSLVGGNGTTYNSAYTDNTYARADEGTARPGYLTLIDDNYIVNGTLYIKNFKTVNFSDYAEIKKIVALEGAEITSNGVGLFNANSKSKLKTVTEIDLSNASISNNLKYLNSMFSGCSNLKTVKFPTGCKASNVEQVGNMFNGCSSLRNVDLGFFDTAKLTYTGYMFSGCSSLKSIDLSGINTENVTNMAYMFSGCSSLESIDLGGFDTSKVNNMDSMFRNCSSLKELDLRCFDTANVTYMARMFNGCTSLKTILAGDSWTTDKVTAGSACADMFTGCTSLAGGNGTVYSADHTDKEYARIDKRDVPGYFTADSTIEIIVQPTDKSGIIGNNVNFTVVAAGEGLTYQWQYDSGSGWKNSTVTGSKTPSLSVKVTEARNGIKYRCVIKDEYGREEPTDAATLTAVAKITKQPSDTFENIGDTAKFAVGVTGAGLMYQWQYDNGSGWKNSGMTGANTAILSVPVTEARNGQKYRCVIKDANGKVLESNSATLKVTTKITKQPDDYSGPIGDTAKFTVTATGAGLTYQWQYDSGSGWKNSNMSGSKTATLKAPITEGRNGLKFRCVIKDANGKETASNAATLKVTAKVTKHPVEASGCVGDTVKFTVGATGVGLTYQWQYDNGSGWKDSGMTGAKTPTLSVPVTEARNGQKYRCVIKDANGKEVKSNAAALKVITKITKQPVSKSGAIGTTVKFQFTATGAGLKYQWQYDNGSGWKDSGMEGAKTTTLSVPVTAARNGQKYRCVIKDANGKTTNTATVTLTVKK